MKRKSYAGGIVGALMGLAGIGVAGLLTVGHYFTDFSSEEFNSGPLLEADGWETASGFVDVVEDPVLAGEYAIRLQGNQPASVLQKTIEVDPEANVLFYDLYVRPATGSDIHNSARVASGLASIAFVRDEGEERARVVARDLSQSSGWLDTGVGIPVDFAGQAKDFHRMTLRLDAAESVLDLYLDGAMVAHDLQTAGLAAGEDFPFRVFGAGMGETFVDDFYAGEHNPLFDDPLGTGIPAEWLADAGLDPDFVDRYQTLEDGRTAIEAFVEEQRAALGDGVEDPSEFTPERSSSSRRLVVFTPLERPAPLDRSAAPKNSPGE